MSTGTRDPVVSKDLAQSSCANGAFVFEAVAAETGTRSKSREVSTGLQEWKSRTSEIGDSDMAVISLGPQNRPARVMPNLPSRPPPRSAGAVELEDRIVWNKWAKENDFESSKTIGI